MLLHGERRRKGDASVESLCDINHVVTHTVWLQMLVGAMPKEHEHKHKTTPIALSLKFQWHYNQTATPAIAVSLKFQ
eukprot:8618722-Alexandrium_andersonii.AAC.1